MKKFNNNDIKVKSIYESKNLGIEMLRAILILMVIFYHYTYKFEELFNIKTINFVTLSKWGGYSSSLLLYNKWLFYASEI